MLSLVNVRFIILKTEKTFTDDCAWLRKSVSAHHVRMAADLNLVDKRLEEAFS